jgi:tetratricopeptide (TPR) repeat protein
MRRKEALTTFDRCYQFAQQNGLHSDAWETATLVAQWVKERNKPLAVTWLQKGLRAVLEAGDMPYEAQWNRGWLIWAYDSMGANELALAMSLEELQSVPEDASIHHTMQAKWHVARFYRKLGNLEKAWEYLGPFLKHYECEPSKTNLLLGYTETGFFFLGRGCIKEARQAYNDAVADFKNCVHPVCGCSPTQTCGTCKERFDLIRSELALLSNALNKAEKNG